VAGALPDAKLEMMPGAGHLCWIDDVDRAADFVRAHLAEVPALASEMR